MKKRCICWFTAGNWIDINIIISAKVVKGFKVHRYKFQLNGKVLMTGRIVKIKFRFSWLVRCLRIKK